jgi:hypothetical protein
MSQDGHVADAEVGFRVLNVTPDFCEVDGQVVPFEIYRELPPERVNYAKAVRARGVPVLTIVSVVSGVIGNMGKGVFSTVSQKDGHTMLLQGVESVRAEGNPVCRDQHLCLLNGKVQ